MCDDPLQAGPRGIHRRTGDTGDERDPLDPLDDTRWRGHLDVLCRYVRRRLGRAMRVKETSLDLALSVCREALEARPGALREDDPGFRRWLCTRAENKIKDRVRFWGRDRRAIEREVTLPSDREASRDGLDDDGLRSLFTPSRDAAGREDLERLDAALRALPPQQREVILLARVAGLPHEEIAHAMGRSTTATRSLLSRSLARLALALERPAAASQRPDGPQGPNVTT